MRRLCELLDRAEALMGGPLPLTPEAREALIASADGDGRFLLNQAETLFVGRARRAARSGRARRAACTAASRSTTRTARAITTSSRRCTKVDPRLRPAGGALLSRAHARRRRGAALRAPPPDPRRGRGHRPRRPARRWSSASPPRMPTISSARPRANWRSSRPASISPPRPNRTRPTRRRRAAWGSAEETGSLMPPTHILNAPTG